MQLISIYQIVTREKKRGPRIVIPPNSRFNTDDYPMISPQEWDAMLKGTPQVVRTPDDPAFVRPKESVVVSEAPKELVPEAVSEIVKLAPDDDDDDDDPPPKRARGRSKAKVEDDDDDDI